MSEEKILVPEQVTENVEQTTEQTPVKMFTQDEVNEIVGKAKARTKAKIEKRYEQEYGELRDVLKAGTGKESVEEITTTFADYYRQKGVPIQEKPKYTTKDIEVLAKADAEDIISGGLEEVIEETERLSAIGVAGMTDREKAMFKTLAEYRQNAERGKELSGIGVTEEVYNSKEFREFAGKFNRNTPIKDVYDIYTKTQPKKDIKPMGSMKSGAQADSGVKEFYSVEEVRTIPTSEYYKNPALWEAVQRSMTKWKL